MGATVPASCPDEHTLAMSDAHLSLVYPFADAGCWPGHADRGPNASCERPRTLKAGNAVSTNMEERVHCVEVGTDQLCLT